MVPNKLITRIAELQLDVHRLNNIINPIPHLVPFNHEEAPSEEDEDDGIISNGESEEDMYPSNSFHAHVSVSISLCNGHVI